MENCLVLFPGAMEIYFSCLFSLSAKERQVGKQNWDCLIRFSAINTIEIMKTVIYLYWHSGTARRSFTVGPFLLDAQIGPSISYTKGCPV